MTPFFSRFRDAVSRRVKPPPKPTAYKHSPWERLPDNVLVSLLTFCKLKDIASLALTCHSVYSRLVKNESAIARSWLNFRINICAPPYNDHDFENDIGLSPSDDLTFIASLFPPPPPLYAIGDGHEDADYSIAYLADLESCWTTCIRLCYHLADHTVRHHLDTDPVIWQLWNSSKTETEYVYTKAVETLQKKLLPSMAYCIFFLESAASDGLDLNCSGQAIYLSTSIRRQQAILQKPPFTDTQVLISTQHCMQLMCSTVRQLMSPNIPHSSSENWVALLLSTCTLKKIVEFFAAIAKDEEMNASRSHHRSWSHRKQYLLEMRETLGQYIPSAKQTRHTASKSKSVLPTLDQVWFGAAYRELRQREAIPHPAEYPIHILHGSEMILGCKYCDR
ncbi:hypothetical protein N7495_009629 [Penicillium taxi]|uniref:uncharacterized protein n=1 Tax=Penicillium taxi TaxID=168475 RepID=UPI002544E62B|nr:uncharacterized protein N7495_009629 [Penicillium taxi]KAJ5885119.1 hypothetical protein N7495_009629 [Penicillium taxi]